MGYLVTSIVLHRGFGAFNACPFAAGSSVAPNVLVFDRRAKQVSALRAPGRYPKEQFMHRAWEIISSRLTVQERADAESDT